MTVIKTDDMILHLPPSWPEDYRLAEFVRDGVYMGLGYVGPRAPGLESDAALGGARAFAPGVLRRPIDLVAEGLVARGPFPDAEAARQAAWADSAVVRRASPPLEDADARRARRAGELHRCAACQATYRGDVSPSLVLRPGDHVEVEDADGAVAFAGLAEDWAPRVAQVVVSRAKEAIERMGREAGALAEARQGAGYAAGVVVGAGTLTAFALVSDVGWMRLGWEPRAPGWASIVGAVGCLFLLALAGRWVEREHRGLVLAAWKIVAVMAVARLLVGLPWG